MDPGSTRRLAALIAPFVVAIANGKLGLGLSETTVTELIALAGTFFLASNWKAVSIARANQAATVAAEAVKTVDDAEKVLKGGTP